MRPATGSARREWSGPPKQANSAFDNTDAGGRSFESLFPTLVFAIFGSKDKRLTWKVCVGFLSPEAQWLPAPQIRFLVVLEVGSPKPAVSSQAAFPLDAEDPCPGLLHIWGLPEFLDSCSLLSSSKHALQLPL